ncbi:hypothetical protein PAXRUDRAFT_831457 [Paxillus rubicundulus Ve08.2h10]|uniref:Uncharacterized protein n=1 Tax=Paxillus rubicundulus Ve08.2h10 TaxID=930991 RepID=A0A0D0DIA9_9AGAM|nr:hypothetical protein PAXRUDRAFT_831457 [Paxillus rubicundulus Ve08.2h10]
MNAIYRLIERVTARAGLTLRLGPLTICLRNLYGLRSTRHQVSFTLFVSDRLRVVPVTGAPRSS